MHRILILTLSCISLFGDTYTDLRSKNLIQEGKPVRLHLGCGGCFLKSYINIDFPPSEHTTLENHIAQHFCDLRTMKMPERSVDAVRNHHVFEHFDRATTLALLSTWQRWLKVGGKIIIETPDFKGAIKNFLQETDRKKQNVILRHIFGSHEAEWAVHWDGWFAEKFEHIFSAFGFEDIEIREFAENPLLNNVCITATKSRDLSETKRKVIAEEILKESLVSLPEERQMLKVWKKIYSERMQALR